jgi:hypothetical protein
MTRRLRPPAPLWVCCCPDGRPVSLRRGGRERTITRIAATWERPAPWWAEDEEPPTDPLRAARTYYRVIVDGVAAYEIFHVEAANLWYIERIID